MTTHRAVGSELAALIIELQGMTDFCETLLAQVDGAAARVSAEWTSLAATTFQELHTEWAAGAAKMQSGMTQVTRSANDADAAYGDVADLHSKAWL